jgi:hypothetical protein
MAPIPAFLQKAAVKRGLALLMLAIENREKIKPLLRPVLDRGLRILIDHADSQGGMTPDEGARLQQLAGARAKGRGASGEYGWTFEERLAVVMLLEKAYRDNRQAQWVLGKVQGRLTEILGGGAAPASDGARDGVVDGVAWEESPGGESVTISREEYERLMRAADAGSGPTR